MTQTIGKGGFGKNIFAFLSMLFGAMIMVVLIVFMNQYSPPKEPNKQAKSRAIEIARVHKATPKPKPKPKPKRTKPKSMPKAPMPNLSSALSGIDLGIPEFAVDDIAGSADSLLGDVSKDLIMSESSVDIKPRVTSRSPMEYPKYALKKKIKGYVLINMLVGEDGSVEVAKVIEANPPGVFDNVALQGVRNWRFSPAMYKGKPVKVWAKQRVRFDFN